MSTLLADGDSKTFDPAVKPGDPMSEPATFTRFVLPFPYRAHEPGREKTGGLYFEETEAGDWLHSPLVATGAGVAPRDRERRDYFTRETTKVLYARAKWFLLRGKADETDSGGKRHVVDFTRRDGLVGFTFHSPTARSLEVQMRAPALVLFEWPEHQFQEPPDHSASEPENDPLRVGFIVLELYFGSTQGADTAPTLDDLLALNELFRYWQRPYEKHSLPAGDYCHALEQAPVDLRHPGQTVSTQAKSNAELNAYLRRWDWYLKCPLVMDDGRRFELVESEEVKAVQAWVCGKQAAPTKAPEQPTEPYGWMEYADHRAFVWTCAVLDTKLPERKAGEPEARPRRGPGQRQARLLQGLISFLGIRRLDYWPECSGHWIRLLNVDLPKMEKRVANGKSWCCTAFEREWVDKRTYKRWAHCGALYGFNYHAGAMLTAYCDVPPTWRHFRDMYFDQTLLMLYLRTVLFRFSLQLSRVSELGRATVRRRDTRPAISDEFLKEFAWLRHDFAMFTNLYQFPLLSNQQQGIEMYAMCRKAMDVDDLFKEVQAEIESTHEFLNVETATHIGETTLILSVVATAGLAVSLLLAYFGADKLLEGQLVLPWQDAAPRFAWPLVFALGLAALATALFMAVTLFFARPIYHCMEWWHSLWKRSQRRNR